VAALEVEILTLFPRMCAGYLAESILGKAQESGLLEVRLTDIRDFAEGRHRIVDDAPYGGGAGMVMKPEPMTDAIEAARHRMGDAPVLLTSPRGRPLEQGLIRQLAARGRFVVACGRYEGVDERVLASVDLELSVGDVILTGGELAALCIVDAAARWVPGVLGNDQSAGEESFSGGEGLLEHPHYTRPPVYRGMAVPEVLLSGDHRRIEQWRRREALRATRDRRPDLFARLRLSEEDLRLLESGEDER
jgi:tRNA (guanine37-N1)-methyltransferase